MTTKGCGGACASERPRFADAGYDHLCIHQIGDDQAGFFEFYRDEVLPKLL